MKLKKIAATICAAAVMATAAALPQTTQMFDKTASAAAVSTYKTDDVFYAPFDQSTGALKYDEPFDSFEAAMEKDTDNAIYECVVLDDGTISVNVTCMATSFVHYGEKIAIPKTIFGYTVTEITHCNGAYTSIKLPETVKTIGDRAFESRVLLEEIDFGENSQLQKIGEGAFIDCRSLKSVKIPASVETIGDFAFCNSYDRDLETPIRLTETSNLDLTNTYSLKSVEFSEGSKLKSIGAEAFRDQKSLTSITIPASVETIGDNAFAIVVSSEDVACLNTIEGSLKEVVFAENSKINYIGRWAFGNQKLQSIDIPENIEIINVGAFATEKSVKGTLTSVNFSANSKLKCIDQWAFQGQGELKSINIPESVEKIGYGAFLWCSSLSSIDIPKNVDEIGAYAFATNGSDGELGNVSQFTVDKDNEYFMAVDGVLYSKDGKTLVAYPVAKDGEFEIPADVETIADGAFAFSHELVSITIPESVTSIGEDAFMESSLKNINGVAGSYAETFAKENGYTFNGKSSSGSSGSSSSSGSTTTTTTDTESTFKDDSEDKAADIEVVAKPNVIPKEAHFSVRFDDKNSTDTRVAYNCFFTYNGAEYEPTDKVTVRIPVPVAMRDIADTLKVYHLQDGKYVNMKAKVEDGYLVFETDHFSTYVVTAEELEETAENTETPTTTETTPADTTTNPPTGVAVALIPVILAGAVVVVSAKKKK